jgi:4a-hydroxytetrahydrobiopterin dehydratase
MERVLSRQQASEAVSVLGWRYLLGTLRTMVRVDSLTQGAELAAVAVQACAADADAHLDLDLRPDRLVLTLKSRDRTAATDLDVELADKVTAAVAMAGCATEPGLADETPRSVQMVEIAIDAMDIAEIRAFWKAVLGYGPEAGRDGPEDPLIDPVGQSPAIWFQQMDRPRPQRNRIHLDICVPHDEAERRIGAALTAGGRLLSADRAPAFWVLSDAEGNEACITTWQGRDG